MIGGGVVINAGRAFLEQRGDDDDLVFFRELAKGVGAGAGNFFGELEILVVFALAKILRAEKFLRADDFCAGLRGAFDEREGFLKIRVRTGGDGSLNQPQFDEWTTAARFMRSNRRLVQPRGFLEDDGLELRVIGAATVEALPGQTVRG